jgi:hypothetical protein
MYRQALVQSREMTAVVAGGGGVKITENKLDNVVFVLHINSQLMPICESYQITLFINRVWKYFNITGFCLHRLFPCTVVTIRFFHHSKIAILCPLFWVVRCTINSCFYHFIAVILYVGLLSHGGHGLFPLW